MREWLDCDRPEPMKFKYDQEGEAVVVSVEFLDDNAGEALLGVLMTTRRLDLWTNAARSLRYTCSTTRHPARKFR
jgi:hypothetical protein